MSPEIDAIKERKCGTCRSYGFKKGAAGVESFGKPHKWRWAYCELKKKWFPESIEFPGEKKGCEDWS